VKKDSIRIKNGKGDWEGKKLTIGMDLGDRTSRYCVLGEGGEVLLEASVATTQKGLSEAFSALPPCRIAIETGQHSPWVSRHLSGLGHEVIVAHAQSVRLIGESTRKDDRLDAKTLARLARVDPALLSPVRHRSAEAQAHLTRIRARAVLVGARTALVNAIRGLTKAYGERLRKCHPEQIRKELAAELSSELRTALEPLFQEVQSLTERIQHYDHEIEKIAKQHYPEVAQLQQVNGVGTLIALTYVLTVDDPHRFGRSRDLGC